MSDFMRLCALAIFISWIFHASFLVGVLFGRYPLPEFVDICKAIVRGLGQAIVTTSPVLLVWALCLGVGQ